MSEDPNQQVLNYHDAQLYKSDIDLFTKNKWLNDQCIHFYFKLTYYRVCNASPEICMLDPALVAFISFQADSEDLHDLNRSLQLGKKKFMLIPVNDAEHIASGGSHWSLLSYDIVLHQFQYYDSSGSANYLAALKAAEKISFLRNKTFSVNIMTIVKDCPQQENGYDCGVYVLLVAEWICRTRYCKLTSALREFVTGARVRDTRREIPSIVTMLKESATASFQR